MRLQEQTVFGSEITLTWGDVAIVIVLIIIVWEALRS